MKATSPSPKQFEDWLGLLLEIDSVSRSDERFGKPIPGFDIDWDAPLPLPLRQTNLDLAESKWFRARVRELLKPRMTLEAFACVVGVSKRNLEMRLSPSGGRLHARTANRLRAALGEIVPINLRTAREDHILNRMAEILAGQHFIAASRESVAAAIVVDILVRRGLINRDQAHHAFIYGLGAMQKTIQNQDQYEAALSRLSSNDPSSAYGFRRLLEVERDWPSRTA